METLAYVFIHVERLYVLEGEFSILIILDQFLVTTQGGASWGQTNAYKAKVESQHFSFSLKKKKKTSMFLNLIIIFKSSSVIKYLIYTPNIHGKIRQVKAVFCRFKTLWHIYYHYPLNIHNISSDLPVGSPRVKYLSGPGLNSKILFLMYFAAHSLALS